MNLTFVKVLAMLFPQQVCVVLHNYMLFHNVQPGVYCPSCNVHMVTVLSYYQHKLEIDDQTEVETTYNF